MLGLSLLVIISIITAFQLLMLGAVLLAKGSKRRQSNHILSVFMFSNALLMIYFLVSILNIFNIPSISIFYYLLGPLMYLYVRSMCVKNFSLKPVEWLHGIVFAGMILFVFGNAIFLGETSGELWNYNEYLVSQIILHAQIVFYIVASILSIYKYRREIKNHFSALEKINLSWLLLIIVAFSAMWLADFIAFLLTTFSIDSGRVIYFLLLTSVTINLLFANLIVYKGLRQADAFSGTITPGKYSGSKITQDESRKIAEQLKDFMLNEKPFLNSELTIRDLSENLAVHHKFLSQVINSQFDQNFYDFVNQYRVQEAKEIISKNRDEKMTILEILYEVGFNSKSAFNNAFKKSTGKTPSEFKKLAT